MDKQIIQNDILDEIESALPGFHIYRFDYLYDDNKSIPILSIFNKKISISVSSVINSEEKVTEEEKEEMRAAQAFVIVILDNDRCQISFRFLEGQDNKDYGFELSDPSCVSQAIAMLREKCKKPQ